MLLKLRELRADLNVLGSDAAKEREGDVTQVKEILVAYVRMTDVCH